MTSCDVSNNLKNIIFSRFLLSRRCLRCLLFAGNVYWTRDKKRLITLAGSEAYKIISAKKITLKTTTMCKTALLLRRKTSVQRSYIRFKRKQKQSTRAVAKRDVSHFKQLSPKS